jgi:hypothetical protein
VGRAHLGRRIQARHPSDQGLGSCREVSFGVIDATALTGSMTAWVGCCLAANYLQTNHADLAAQYDFGGTKSGQKGTERHQTTRDGTRSPSS